MEQGVGKMYSTSKQLTIQAPLPLVTKTPHKTVSSKLPGFPLWHFQVFTVLTINKGKQQTEPIPVSASHWETNLKHQKIELFFCGAD